MKYLKLKFLLMFFALAMAIPPAWAAEAGFSLAEGGTVPIAANANPATCTITGTQEEIWNVAIEGTFSFSAFQGRTGDRYWQMGSNTASFEMATFSTSGINGTITKIVVVCGSGASNGNTAQLSVDVNNQPFSETQSMPTWSNNAGGELTFTGSASGPISIKIFPVTKKACYIQSITVTYKSTNPWVTVDPSSLTINDVVGENNKFEAKSGNIYDDYNINLGVTPHNDFSCTGESNYNSWEGWGFRKDANREVDGIVTVTYGGRALYATDNILVATTNASQEVAVTYRSDIYIYGDYLDNQGWRFADETPMTFANNTYTATVNIENEGSCILFGRKLNSSYGWNDDRLFFSAKKTGNWGDNYEIQDWIYGTDECNELEFSTNSQYHCIKFKEKGIYTITIDAEAKTFSIVKAPEPTGPVTYEKVKSTDDLTDGNYLIVYESGNVAFDGSRTDLDVIRNTKSVTIDDESITTSDPIYFTYDSNAKTLKSASGYYIGRTATSNGLDQSQSAGDSFVNNITIDEDGNASIILPNQSDLILKYNKNSGQERFRYFTATNTQQAIQLYKEVGSNKVATPTFNPAADTYTEAQEVTISCATDGVTIHYTTNGDDPDEFSEVYSTPISVTETTTIKAIAMKDGWRSSSIAEAVYTIVDLSNKTKYTKVTNSADLTDGYYLIVYEDGKLAFDGSLETLDASSNTFDDLVIPSDNIIYTDKEAYFTIDVDAGTIKSASGKYIGNPSDSNGLTASDDALTNTISIDNGYAVIVSEGGAYLRYNATSGQDRFRYFKSSTYTAQKAIQLYKSEIVPVPELGVSLPEVPAENYKVGQVVKVKATVENGSDNTVLTYKVGEETLTPDNEGNVTLPNKKSGEVILTVTADDGERTATDSKTYVFDPAEALTITLDPATGTYYVGDEQNVTVTVKGAIATNPTITYKFGEEGETQTYNAETGIELPTTQAGIISLTVMVDDGGYEHTGATTATGTYTVNHKALTITLTPESGNYTVGQENPKVKVEITNVVGELQSDYALTYKVGEEVKNATVNGPDAEGYITLPNDKAVTYTLTVTALDDREDGDLVEKTGTYTFTALPAITFDLSTDQVNYTVGDVVKVKATDITGTFGEYDVTYMIGETTLKPDEEGYVTIPSDEAGEVVLTVTVEDLYEHESAATQEITFHFAAGKAIGITLTATPEEETYTVGEKVNVKVTTTNTIGNDVLITYTTDFESKAEPTYDPEKGIDITSDKAGDVTLTVNVYDGYAHEGADENGITTKTANYTFVKAPAINITFDPASGTEFTVGQEAKVKVTIAGAADDYEAEYKIGDNVVEPVDGYIVLPNTATDDVTLTVSVYDGIDRIGADESGFTTATATYIFNNVVVAAPTFTPEPGSYTEAKTVTITCPTQGAVVSYSTDGGNNWTPGNTVTVNEDMTLMAKAVMNGVETTANAVYSFEFPVEPINIEPLEGYYQIKNNGNGKYAYVQGRRTLNFTDAPADKAGTVIYVKTDGHGQVQSLRSQAADLQGYADKAMNYVPELVHLVAQKLETEGVGELFGETGVNAILAKFNESFDHHLYVEPADGGYRIYGKTPSMQPVVEFYRENQAKVDAKLPMLEDAINNAIDKILEKTNGSGASILTKFSVDTIWKHMNNPYLIEPVDDASTMAFYHQVLMNKDYVWSFAYETAMIYWTNLKKHPRYETMIKPQLGEFAQYLEKIEQVRPNFKYYIAQKNDKPDFISQGNVDVNQPRNIWTVEPRANFVVNVPEANKVKDGYVTTLYTDFAYTLPEGVTAYKVTAVDENGYATTEAIGNAVPAQTPVLLIAAAKGDYTLTLSTEAGTAVENNLLKGPDYLIGEYQIKNPTVEKMFNLVKGLFGEEIYNRYMLDYEHLMLRYAGLVNNKYFWGLSEEDVAKCVYTNEYDEEYCVVRSLDVKDGQVAFYDNSTVSTNKAFLVTETLDKIMLEKPEVAAPTFTPEPGSYTEAKTVTIGCATEGATILYSTDGGNNWTPGNTVTVDEDMTLMAKAVMNGVETTANAVYSFEFPVEPINIEPLEGYYQIKNNGNGKYAYVQGRRTLNFTDAPDDKAGTVIYVKTDGHGQVQSLRSQAADLQGYADKAMNYVPELVHLVAQKLETEGVGELFGSTGVDAILAKFDESFDHHLYVEPAEGGYRIYGKTPSMQPVVEFYRENQAKVDAKLPMLEEAINNAIDKILEKTNGSGASILEHFSLHTIWEKMNDANLIEPTNDASTMAFYHQVLMNKDYVWSFAYETAMIYWTNLKSHPRYENEIKPQLGEFAQYLEKIEQVRPNFKYYIAQKNDKPDFISQGNVDVNQPRNIWTVEPRTDFTVNIAGEMFGCPYAGGLGGYVTSLYTDFAYTLPGGVTAYTVTAVDENGQAELTALEDVVPAQTPILLIAKEEGDYSLTLSTEAGTPVENNLLKGPDYLIGEYQIKNPTVEKMFNLVKGLFGEEIYNRYMLDYEHLMLRYAGLVNNKYFWGLSEEDVAKCVYTNEYDEEYCVVRSLDVKDGQVAFYDNSTVSTNKAFLVTETLDKITLDGLRGDVNHDGDVNIKDVSDLIDRLLGNEANSCPYCSDVNCDDDVNIKDVSDLIDFLLNSGADTHVDTPTTDPEGGE